MLKAERIWSVVRGKDALLDEELVDDVVVVLGSSIGRQVGNP